MAHQTLKILPGVNRNRTLALNELQISETNLVRFIPDREGLGLVEKLGGWQKFYPASLNTIIRGLWAWQDTNGKQHLAAGGETVFRKAVTAKANGAQIILTYDGLNPFEVGDKITLDGFLPLQYNGVHTVLQSYLGYLVVSANVSQECDQLGTIYTGSSLYVITDGALRDITPGYELSSPYVKVSTKAGSPVCVIEDPKVKLDTGDCVYIKTPISVGGIVLLGAYEVTNIDQTNFSVVSRDILGNLKPATKTVDRGGVLPSFDFEPGSPYITVTLPNHGYSDGDVFPVLYPVQAGVIFLYGNYAVSLGSVVDPINTFTITTNNIATSTFLQCRPLKATSDGQYVTFTLQKEFGVVPGDKIRVVRANPSTYDGEYTVTQVANEYIVCSDSKNWNFVSDTGFFYKSNGGDGKNLRIAYNGPYYVNVGDTAFLAAFEPKTYNGLYEITAVGDNNVTVATTATGSITSVAELFVKHTVMNNGLPIYQYYNSNAILPVSSGYGVSGYGVGGYGIGGQTPPKVEDDISVIATDWLFDNWGENLIACAPGGPIYQWSPISGSSTASVIAQAPIVNDGMFVAMPQRQIISWGSTFNGIQDPLLIRWCDVSNYAAWGGTVTNQAGSYRIAKGSKIVGGIQGPQQGLIWTDIALWSMQYTGLPYVYSFTEIGTGCGLISRKAAGSLNGNVYWMGQSQFYSLTSEGVQIIPCPCWDVIFQELDTNNLDKIRFAANSNFAEVSWFYPTSSAGGENGRYVKYNTLLNCWDYGILDRTAWINQSVFGPPIGASANMFIYQHEVGLDADGQNMQSYFKTGYAQIGEGEYKIFVDQIWPDFKWGFYDGDKDANLKISFFVTDYAGDTPKIYGPMPMDKTTQYLTPRFRGRLVSVQVNEVEGPSNTQSFWRIGALRYRASPDGKF